jgi:hypothetical protein
MTEATNELMFEVLKRMQGDLADFRGDSAELGAVREHIEP